MGSADCFDWLGQVQWRLFFLRTTNLIKHSPDGQCWLFWLTRPSTVRPWWRGLTVLTDCTMTLMGCVDWLTVPGTVILMESVDCFDWLYSDPSGVCWLTDCSRYNDPNGECWLFRLTVQWPWWGMLTVLTDCGQVQWPWSGKLTVWLTMMARVECGLWLWPGVIKPWWGVLTVWLTVARCDKTLMRSVDCLTDCGQVQWSAGGELEARSEEESGYRSGRWLHHVLHVWFLWASLLVSLFPASTVFTFHMTQDDKAGESEISFISLYGKMYVRVR